MQELGYYQFNKWKMSARILQFNGKELSWQDVLRKQGSCNIDLLIHLIRKAALFFFVCNVIHYSYKDQELNLVGEVFESYYEVRLRQYPYWQLQLPMLTKMQNTKVYSHANMGNAHNIWMVPNTKVYPTFKNDFSLDIWNFFRAFFLLIWCMFLVLILVYGW